MVYNSYNKKVSDADIITSLQNDPFPTYKAGSATEYEVNSLTSITLNNSVDTSHPLYNITKDESNRSGNLRLFQELLSYRNLFGHHR